MELYGSSVLVAILMARFWFDVPVVLTNLLAAFYGWWRWPWWSPAVVFLVLLPLTFTITIGQIFGAAHGYSFRYGFHIPELKNLGLDHAIALAVPYILFLCCYGMRRFFDRRKA